MQTKKNNFITPMLLYGLSAIIVVIDRATKYIGDINLDEGVPVPVFPGFDLLLAYNSGAAFSFLSEADGWQRWLLSGVSFFVSLLLIAWIARLPKKQILLGIALAFILGGALGNFYDRLLVGYVIDFISLHFQDYRFATFNIADFAISIGAALMILDIILEHKRNESAGEFS